MEADDASSSGVFATLLLVALACEAYVLAGLAAAGGSPSSAPPLKKQNKNLISAGVLLMYLILTQAPRSFDPTHQN